MSYSKNDAVSVRRCTSYDSDEVNGAISHLLNDLGGISSFVKPGMKVLIKPNLIMKRSPDHHATTHPEIIRAIAEAVISAGGIVTIADSPGGPYNEHTLKSVYNGCGITDIALQTGAVLNYNTEFSDVINESAKLVKSFPVIKPVTRADCVINVCKLKTHVMANFSGGVKNLFGVLPGTYKAEYHFRMSELVNFCTMLCDLCDTVAPVLTVMDGVFGMEGDGPTNGTPRQANIILASRNPYALDLVACKIINMKTENVETLKIGINRGYIPETAEELHIKGDNPDDFIIPDYKKVKVNDDINFTKFFPKFMQKFMGNWINRHARPYPVYDPDKCIKCRRCVDNCPAKCLTLTGSAPTLERDKCIRCFCCHELCPKDAVRIKRSKILSLVHKI